MFTALELTYVELEEVRVRCRVGGTGPPVLLLHGFPQTHAMWHQVAPALARSHTVVAPDLRGYGESSPPAADSVSAYSKRAMAHDQIQLMSVLGYERFSVVGHDRGGRVGYRLALDHPERVARLAVLDIVPGLNMWEAAEQQPAEGQEQWHWNLNAEPDAEKRLTPDHLFPGGSPSISDHKITLAPDALADYLAALERPSVAHAMAQDYRAGRSDDREHDETDRAAGRKIRCPVLALWGARSDLQEWFDPLEVWRQWADEVTGTAVEGSGHFLAEEQPERLLDELLPFLDPR